MVAHDGDDDLEDDDCADIVITSCDVGTNAQLAVTK
jgi:hypothetical protein